MCKNWHLCKLCWEDCKRKELHVPNSPDMSATLTGLLKTARGNDSRACILAMTGRLPL